VTFEKAPKDTKGEAEATRMVGGKLLTWAKELYLKKQQNRPEPDLYEQGKEIFRQPNGR